jgi:hypothetical protein
VLPLALQMGHWSGAESYTVLPLRPGVPERQTHDYRRHGTTTLFAALNMLDGKAIGECRLL